MAKNVSNEVSDSENAKLEAIKQIIFGQNMKEYEHEFNEIRQYITLNLNAIDKKMLEVKEHFEALHTKNVHDLATAENSILDKLDEVQKQLSAQLHTLEKNMAERIDLLEKDLNEKLQKQEAAFTEKTNQLNDAKMDRKKLAQLLTSIAQKIAE